MGWARCRWVYPGSTVSVYSLAMAQMALANSAVAPMISSSWVRRYIRTSSATWSFRLRAVWSRLPASPIRAVSSASMNI